MFLSKKSFKKVLLMTGCYFFLGSISLIASYVFNNMGVPSGFLTVLGIIMYFLCVPVYFWGRYAEGKGIFLNTGNNLVRNELNPVAFIKKYELLKNSSDLVVNKPSFEVLQLLLCAYDCLGDRENALAVVDEMIAVATEKKKARAKLLKSSHLFSYGAIEEAEALFQEVQKQKLDIISKGLVDTIFKTDRAKARGDYKTVEMYNINLLQRGFPKLDNLSKLIVNYALAEVYEKQNEPEKALEHYKYCAIHGGETAMKKSAIEKLEGRA